MKNKALLVTIFKVPNFGSVDYSISDFLQLFANASLVVTSSFHGTAFALNYGRPLVSITPGGGDDRQGTLLQKLSLEKCNYPMGGNIDLCPFYDINEEQMRLQEFRDDSLSWIAIALK